MKQDERKNAVWSYNLLTHVATVLYPSDIKGRFDLMSMVTGLTEQQELMYYYGFKQWVSSNYSSCKTAKEKLESAEADYLGLIEHGIEIIGDGKIGLKNRERSNANSTKTQLSQAKSALELMTKKLSGQTLTAEEEAFIASIVGK